MDPDGQLGGSVPTVRWYFGMYLSGVGLKENSGKLVDVERRVLGKRRLVESHLLTSLVRGDWLRPQSYESQLFCASEEWMEVCIRFEV